MFDEQTRSRLRAALMSDDLKLVVGKGDAETPGQGRACTISEIMLVLTGELTDDCHPHTISKAIHTWVIHIQDSMPSQIRNSAAWRRTAVDIPGTGGDGKDPARGKLALDWMWDALSDPDVVAAVPPAACPSWLRMIHERTRDSADDALATIDGISADRRVASRAATAASSVKHALTYDALAYEFEFIDDGPAAVAHTAQAVTHCAALVEVDLILKPDLVIPKSGLIVAGEFWTRQDPARMLRTLIDG